MRKVVIIIGLACSMASCVNKDKAEEKLNQATTEEKKEDPAVAAGLELIAESDCLTCHKLNEAGIGPAYEAIAAKYSPTEQVIDTLASKIINGGAGNWGTVQMTPHPQISKDDAKKMVQYIMSLKK